MNTEEQILTANVIAVINGKRAEVALAALVNAAASILCEKNASKEAARLDAFGVGAAIAVVVGRAHDEYRQAVDKDKAACN